MAGPACLGALVREHAHATQYGLPCPHRPTLGEGEVWRGCQGPSQVHDIPAASPPMFLVVVLSRRMAEGMERVNTRVRVPRGMGWPDDASIWYRFQGAICHLDDQSHYVAYFDCPGVGVVRFDDRQVVRVGFEAFATCAKNQMDVALVVFARETRESASRDATADAAPSTADGSRSGESAGRMEGGFVSEGTAKKPRVGGYSGPTAERSSGEEEGREDSTGAGSGVPAPPPPGKERGAEDAEARKRRRAGASMGASGNAKKALVASWSDRGCNDGPGCAGECARPAIGSVVGGVEETEVKQGKDKTKAQSVGEGEERQRKVCTQRSCKKSRRSWSYRP